MTTVVLGNNNPQHLHEGEDHRRKADHLNQAETRVELWHGIDGPALVQHALSTDNDRDLISRALRLSSEDRHYALALHEIESLWPIHAGGTRPAYVWSDDPDLQRVLGEYYNCPQGQPTALLSNAGRDALHAQHWGTSAQPAQFNYLAISTNSGGSFATSDTTLASELTTNGLGRATATYAHTTGTNTTTLTKTWTYTSTGSVVIESMATFNAASTGTLGEEDALASSVTVASSGDTITVTYTGTAG